VIGAEARGSWIEIADRLRPFVARRVSSASEVDDVLQEILLRVHGGVSKLVDETRFGPWIFSVARHAVVDHVRDRARTRTIERKAADDPTIDQRGDDEDRAIEQRLSQYLAYLVTQLPSPYREAITLTEIQGLTQKAAAEMTGISLSGMKSRVQRGRAELKRMLEDCCEIALDARGKVLSCEPRSKGPSDPDCEC
jgi:RNA polymerase sigma-70 factor (ECF subfamily)